MNVGILIEMNGKYKTTSELKKDYEEKMKPYQKIINEMSESITKKHE